MKDALPTGDQKSTHNDTIAQPSQSLIRYVLNKTIYLHINKNVVFKLYHMYEIFLCKMFVFVFINFTNYTFFVQHLH